VFGLISVIKALLDWLPLVENGKLLSLLQFKPLKRGGVQDKAGWPRPSGRLSGTIGRPLRKGRFLSVSRLQHSGLMTRLQGY